MTAPTSSAPTVAGDKPRSMRRQIEAQLLTNGAGRRFELRALPDGRCYLTDVPNCDDDALLRAASGLARLHTS